MIFLVFVFFFLFESHPAIGIKVFDKEKFENLDICDAPYSNLQELLDHWSILVETRASYESSVR